MGSLSRMARAIRSIAAGMSRIVSGSCKSSKVGRRKCRAAIGSDSPRCTRTFAAGGPMRKAAESAETAAGSGAGRRQRISRRETESVFGEKPAKGIALVEIFFGQTRGDLVFHGQVFFVPIRLHLVNVEPRIMIEGQLQRANLSLIATQIAQPVLVIPLPVALQV